MSPAPKKSRKRQADEDTAVATKKKGKGKKGKAAPVDDDEDEDDDQPKRRGRTSKNYGVTGEQIAEMREDGMSWQEIQDEVGAKSAIPLRNMMNKYLAEQNEDDGIDADDGEAIVAARDEDALGWSQIAAKTGLTVAEVKKAYKDAGGENPDGRAYKDKDGKVHFGRASNGASADADDDEQDYDDMSRGELRAELKKRGLDTSGKPSALRQRLIDNDTEVGSVSDDDDDDDDDEPEPTPRRAKGKKKGAKAGR